MKLTLTEANTMTYQDFGDFLEMWLGDDDEDENGDTVRPGTQADINRLFG